MANILHLRHRTPRSCCAAARQEANRCTANGLPVQHTNLRSSYGRDASLLEEARQTKLIKPFLTRLRAEGIK
jgi:hypothetical protein